MSTFEETLALYEAEVKKLNLKLSADLLHKVAKGLGPSLYKADAEKVSSSDPEELARVKKNFLIGKLGLADSPDLDKGIQKVVEQMGVSNRNKYRAIFYALLAQHFKKESVYA